MAPRKPKKAKGKRKAPPAASSPAKESSSKRKKGDTAAAAAAPTRKLLDRQNRGKNECFFPSSPGPEDEPNPPSPQPPQEGFLSPNGGTSPVSERGPRRPSASVSKPYRPTSRQLHEYGIIGENENLDDDEDDLEQTFCSCFRSPCFRYHFSYR